MKRGGGANEARSTTGNDDFAMMDRVARFRLNAAFDLVKRKRASTLKVVRWFLVLSALPLAANCAMTRQPLATSPGVFGDTEGDPPADPALAEARDQSEAALRRAGENLAAQQRSRVGAVRNQKPEKFRDARALDNAPFLPWPPPAPTRMGDISRAFTLKGGLAEVDHQLKDRLALHGYDRLRYFAVPGGFGITTDIERLAANGRPAPKRWLVGKEGGWKNLFAYLSSLISGEDGRFRLFAILVTDEDVRPASFDATETDVTRWKLSGLSYLGAVRGRQAVNPDTRVWLLVYEFTAGRSKGSRIVADRDGRFPFAVHARSLGLR